VRYCLLFLEQIIGLHASSFNLTFAFAVSRTGQTPPFFRLYIRGGVSFFLHLPASDTHVYVCYPIEYAMRMCSEIPFFFLAQLFILFSHMSLSPSTLFFLWKDSFQWTFRNRDVISVDYSVCIPTWREAAEYLWYFLVYDECRKEIERKILFFLI